MVTLTREQARTLLDASAGRPWLHTLVLLGVATGARLGELLALRWTDVDLDEGTARIGASRRVVAKRMEVKAPKTEAGTRTVALGPATVAALRRLRAEQAGRRLVLGGAYDAAADLVICKPDGRPYRPDSASTMFRAFADKAGLPKTVHIHTLRHSAASFLAAAGVPASDIAAQLGHADGGALALRVYVHPLEENRRRAAAHLDDVIGGEQ
jgi:integrase